jgi:hypothetical protein
VVNATTITATTPAHAAGAVNVVVTNPDAQSGTCIGCFTYVAPPTVSGIAPTSGPTAGGTSVTITGTGFVAGATVTFGGTAATGVTVVNPTTITATTPAHAAGAVNVVVTNPDSQSGTCTGCFTYLAPPPAPTVSGVAPTSGATAGGTSVTISGTGFVSGATVTFDGTAATAVTVVNSTTITATTPAHAAGAVTVTVTNPDTQSGSCTGCYTYIAPPPAPTVSGTAPASGPTTGGTSVTISGTGFVSGATVTFGGTAATGVTVVNPTTITATTPAHGAGAVNVTVTNPDGQSGTCVGCFTYVAGPPSTKHSLALDGSTGYAEAPNAAKLNVTGDWTVETWFKDETPGGYNHPFTKLVAKADRNVTGETTYLIVIGNNVLRAGVQHNNVSIYAEADLSATTANAWHHVAAAFTRSTRVLRVYLDGVQVAEQVLGVLSDGNTVPVGMGRAGSGGFYFNGKLDDVRIWNVARTDAEIAASFLTEFTTAPSGLVANWKFNESSGTTAADSTPAPDDATLNGGATFSTDIHP